MYCHVAMMFACLLACCFLGGCWHLSLLHLASVWISIWLSHLVLFFLATGQISFIYQPMRATHIHTERLSHSRMEIFFSSKCPSDPIIRSESRNRDQVTKKSLRMHGYPVAHSHRERQSSHDNKDVGHRWESVIRLAFRKHLLNIWAN